MSMSKVLKSAGYVQKDAKNSHQGYKYASDDAVTTKLREALAANQIFVKSCEVLKFDTGTVSTKSGNSNIANVTVSFMLQDERDGREYGPYQGIGCGIDKGDKAPMKAFTAARKYAIAQVSLTSWGDDPEKDSPELEEPEEETLDENAKNTVMSLMQAKAKEGLPALQEAWGSLTVEARRIIVNLDDGAWWESLKQEAGNVQA